MAEFHDLRNQLNNHRDEKEAARSNLFKEKQKLEKAQRKLNKFLRGADLNDQDNLARKAQLEADVNQLDATVQQQQSTFDQWQVDESEVFLQFQPFIDPRQAIGQMSDDYPFLMFPLRIETRFKKVETAGAIVDQLWLRVYPDDCAVDTFEPLLSETEVANAGIYWSNIWQAGGIEDQERGAWRTLVSSYGSGRAAWITQNYLPENATGIPAKADKNDVILVIRTEVLPPVAEVPAITTFWQAMWLADGDKPAETIAIEALALAVGDARAKEIIEATLPDNFATRPAEPLTDCVFLHLPDSAALETKFQSWSQAPRVNVLPDSLVITGYRNGAVVLNEVLNPVAAPLIVGIDP